jgi:NAD(P)-dependent dehydrogenase (short-subunit alcohol dehydrogenase family)
MTRLSGKTALITGASRGIGAAVALRYAQEGAHVILVARTVGGLEAVDDAIKAVGGNATLVPLDLTESDKIDALGLEIYNRFGKLDILVGNAGMLGSLGPIAHIKPSSWDKVMHVNVTANARLIRSLDPLLRAAPHGRAMFVTSYMGTHPTAYWGAYSVSKAALEMLVKTYAAEIETSTVRANLIDPGMVDTAMLKEAFPGQDQHDTPKPKDITEAFVALAEESCQRNGTTIYVKEFAHV